MYSYLSNKMKAQAQGAIINRLCLLGFETAKGTDSPILQDFSCLPFAQLCQVLKFRNEEDVHQYLSNAIQQSTLGSFLATRANRTGFLAEIYVPQKHELRISVAGITIGTSTYSDGYVVQWVYANTLGEITDKVIEISANCRNAQPDVKKHKYTTCKN
jgi:hypothetical protein